LLEITINVNTSLTSVGKLNRVTTDTTESINYKITLTPTCNMPCNFFWRYWEPALWQHNTS